LPAEQGAVGKNDGVDDVAVWSPATMAFQLAPPSVDR